MTNITENKVSPPKPAPAGGAKPADGAKPANGTKSPGAKSAIDFTSAASGKTR